MLKNFLCASLPASKSTIKSVPPANGRHTPGSSRSSASASSSVRGTTNS